MLKAYPGDEENFENFIKDIESGKSKNIYCSITYLTPNYELLFTLKELKKLSELGKNCKIYLIMWDYSTLSNSYFRNVLRKKRMMDSALFIDKKIEELYKIVYSLGFNMKNFFIFKSSDLLKRFIHYTEEDLFQYFFNVLAIMNNKFFPEYKSSYMVRGPLDVFFCNFFHKLFPEELDYPMDLAFLGPDICQKAREIMHQEGIISFKKPILIRIEKFLIKYNFQIPNWDHTYKEVKKIINNSFISRQKIFKILYYLTNENDEILVDKELISYNFFLKEFKKASEMKLKDILTENLYSFLKLHKNNFLNLSQETFRKSFIKPVSKKNIQDLGGVMKSKVALDILLLSDGKNTTRDISKILKKSITEISTYVSKLKKLNLISVDKNNCLNRIVKGIKIEFQNIK